MLDLHTKYRIIELKNEMCKCSILTAIASGYAGRDPQGGFCDRSVYSFIEIVIKTKREFFSIFKVKKMEKRIMLC